MLQPLLVRVKTNYIYNITDTRLQGGIMNAAGNSPPGRTVYLMATASLSRRCSTSPRPRPSRRRSTRRHRHLRRPVATAACPLLLSAGELGHSRRLRRTIVAQVRGRGHPALGRSSPMYARSVMRALPWLCPSPCRASPSCVSRVRIAST